MKYRFIPNIPIECLPKHINLLRNLQDMHQAIVRLPETFPVLELGDIIPNYEGHLPDLLRRGKKILAHNNIDVRGWDQEVQIDLSVYAMSAHQLVARKKALTYKLEQLIVRWQAFVDEIDSGDPAG